MSVARGFGLNGTKLYTNVCKPMEVNLNFTVDSTNGNGLGIRSLKSNGYVESVFMNTSAGAPNGTPTSFALARTYAVLGASAVTSTGSTVLTGNLGLYPGTAVTGFPPGTFSGTENIANAAALAAQNSAQATYTQLQALTPTTIATALDTQSLTPGTYKAASGTFTLAQSGNGTLTLTGAGVYVFQTTTTLTTGAGGTPTITLAGGARASDIYWVVGSSATINSGNTGTFQGNIIAQTSITDTLGGTVNGTMAALIGAVTMSAATTGNVQTVSSTPAAGNPNPAPGYALVTFKNNFNYYLGGFSGQISPLSSTTLTSTTAGQAYVITVLGTTTLAQWQTAGLPAGFTPTVGQAFIALTTASIGGTGKVGAPGVPTAAVLTVVGDPNQMIANSSIAANAGAKVLVQFSSPSGVTAPADNTVVGMMFSFDGSSVTIDGL